MDKCQNISEASHEDAVAGVGEGLNAPDLVRVVMWESKTIESPDMRINRRHEICAGMEALVPMENLNSPA